MQALSVLVLLSVAVPSPAVAGPPAAILTSIGNILDLPRLEAGETQVVRITGVVTAVDARHHVCFVQDDTGGVQVLLPTRPKHLSAGDRIEVDGVVNPGRLAPVVVPRRVQVLGNAPFPPPLRVPWVYISTGVKHGQWVEVTGQVTSVTTGEHHTVVQISSIEGEIEAQVAGVGLPHPQERLFRSRVRVAGVCTARFNAQGEFAGGVILVPGSTHLTIERPAPARPFDMPSTPFRDILKHRHADRAGDPIRVSGVVELFRPGISLFLTDGREHLYVQTSDTEILRPGDRVDVLGSPDFVDGAPALVDAVYRRISEGPDPQARPVEARQLLDSAHDSGLVSVEARLLQSSSTADQTIWLLRAGVRTFEAILDTAQLPPSVASLAPDSSR